MASNTFEHNDKELETFTLIWLDADINGKDNKAIQNELRRLNNDFKLFDNDNACESYLQSVTIDQCIVLISSGRLGRKIVPRIHDIEQIYSIYIYCFDIKANREWANDYSKIKDVIKEPDALIRKIDTDHKAEIYAINNEPLHMNIFDNPTDEFIHSQLLIDYLLKVNTDSNIDAKIFDSCRTQCHQHDLIINRLVEFKKNNSSENSLNFLMKDPMLFKSLTEALQTKNIDLLYLFRRLLRTIYQQLETHQYSLSKTVYAGYLITDDELKHLKNSIGTFVSINTFFVAILHRYKVYRALKKVNNAQKILFEITTDRLIDGIKPFADMKLFNSSMNQTQIVFMLGSMFHIESLAQHDTIWICRMNLSSENHPTLKSIFEQMTIEDGNGRTDILAFANFLARLGKYNDAEKYYKHSLNELPMNQENVHIIFRNLGNAAFLKKDYSKSLEYHFKSLEIKENLLKNDDPLIADCCNCIGIVYFHQNNFTEAIKYYEKALNILKLTPNDNQLKISACLSNIGLVYRTEKKYLKALDYYNQVLQIGLQYLPNDHRDFGEIYHNIGALYWCCGSYDVALTNYNLAHKNKCRNLSPGDPSIALTLENIGLIYENKEDFQQALEYYNKAALIYKETLSLTNSDVIQIETSIARVSVDSEQITTRL